MYIHLKIIRKVCLMHHVNHTFHITSMQLQEIIMIMFKYLSNSDLQEFRMEVTVTVVTHTGDMVQPMNIYAR